MAGYYSSVIHKYRLNFLQNVYIVKLLKIILLFLLRFPQSVELFVTQVRPYHGLMFECNLHIADVLITNSQI